MINVAETSTSKTQYSKTIHTLAWCISITLFVFAVSCWVLTRDFLVPLSQLLESHAGQLSSIVATFSGTLFGFLATILAIIITFKDSRFTRVYRHRGSIKDFLALCTSCLVFLFGIFVLCLGGTMHPPLIIATIALSIGTIVHFPFIIWVFYLFATRE